MAKKKAEPTIKNLQDLLDHFGANDVLQLNRRIYKDTDCGASISVRRADDGTWVHAAPQSRWMSLTEIDAFRIQTIIEGSEATVDSDVFTLPVKRGDVDVWMKEMEAEADRLWHEANDTMTSYRIECGNSGRGAIGAVAYVEAASAAAAKTKLMEALPLDGANVKIGDGIDLRVYFGTKRWGKAEEAD